MKANGGPKRELRLLASVAAGDAWLFLFTSGRFVEQLRALMDASGFAYQHSRLRLGQAPAQRRPRTAPSSWIALAVAHPNRATETVPLISGNRTR
jgi:hypothetical protein